MIKALLGAVQSSGTHSYHGEGGLALRFSMFELGAAVRLERFSLSFAGAATLDALDGLSNVRVDDRLLSGSVWLGLVL